MYAYGGGETHSKGDLQTGLQQLFAGFPDTKSTANRMWIKGNVAIAELAWVGTMSADFMGMKATNKPAGETRLHIMWFTDDGLVKELHEYGDSAGVMAQVAGKKGAPPVPVLRTNPAEVHVAKGTPEEDKLVEWAKAADETFNKDDSKAVAATMADDSDYWLNFTGQPAMKGKKDMTAGLVGWFKAFPDQKWTPVNVWGIDGFAIIEHTLSGTQKGPLGPMPASNKAVSGWHFADIMQPTADGKLQHGWGYANYSRNDEADGRAEADEREGGAAGEGRTGVRAEGRTGCTGRTEKVVVLRTTSEGRRWRHRRPFAISALRFICTSSETS